MAGFHLATGQVAVAWGEALDAGALAWAVL